jgi:hypothetical protein
MQRICPVGSQHFPLQSDQEGSTLHEFKLDALNMIILLSLTDALCGSTGETPREF